MLPVRGFISWLLPAKYVYVSKIFFVQPAPKSNDTVTKYHSVSTQRAEESVETSLHPIRGSLFSGPPPQKAWF